MKTTSLLLLGCLLAAPRILRAEAPAAAHDLTVLNVSPDAPPPSKALYQSLQKLARAASDSRREKLQRLTTTDACRQWQKEQRDFFARQLGGLPERTPLEAQVVGKLDGRGYRIEKVIYASRPRHHVTASLYLPLGPSPHPAVLVACGHSRTAKAADYNQKMCILLARHGLAAFCYDPIGQGERSQSITAEGRPVHSGTTTEHFLMGVGAILVGRNTAQYRVWDGMRAIDYLASREDIDAARIGCTGCSGGGTLTSYLMALDDRVACAAPACYITTFERLIDTIGPQDAEQNIFGQIAYGMDQPDYLIMRAPRPTLICATSDDFFDISGTWDAFRQASRVYGRLGAPQSVALVEADGKHGIGDLGRRAMVMWMRRWLLGVDAPIEEAEAPLKSEQELQCTPRGQVLLLPDEQSVFDLNSQRERELAGERGKSQRQMSPDELRQAVRKTAGIRSSTPMPLRERESHGTIQRGGYRIEKMAFTLDSGAPLPCLLFVPDKPGREACLYLHGRGKHVDAGVGGPIEQLVKQGQIVMAVDLPGIGETSPTPDNEQLGASWKEFYLAYLLGKSLVGLRTEAALSCASFLASYESSGKARPVHLVGIGEAGVAALHAAALAPTLFASQNVQGAPRSWAEIVRTTDPAGQLVNAVHGALRVYDLPDLARLCRGDSSGDR